MSIKIWGRINSTNVRKALWCAEEMGLPYEQIDAGGAFGVVETAQYKAMNPNGRIPCLQDGDFVLWESNAICRYLARTYGKAPFLPETAQQWATADQWMDWASLSFAEPFRDVFWNLVRLSPAERDEAAIARGAAQCAQLFAIADAALAGQPFLSGETLGLADIPLGCLAYAWFSLDIERPSQPHLEAWYGRLCEREAYRKAVMTALT